MVHWVAGWVLLACVGGCADTALPQGAQALDLSGTVVRSDLTGVVPHRSQLSLYWQIPAEYGSYSWYHHAAAAVEGARWALPVQQPPAEARSSMEVTFGYLLLHLDDYPLPEPGPISGEGWIYVAGYAAGRATNYVVVLKEPSDEPNPNRPWLDPFPPGLSCGVVGQPAGETVQYAPTACETIEVEVPGDFFPEWR
jgi:hypothetical protein